MDAIDFHSYWTVLLFVLFIAIVAWAWSSKRKAGFDELANLPLEEEKFAKPIKSEEKDNV